MTVRGGGHPGAHMAFMPPGRMGPPPRSFAADAHDCNGYGFSRPTGYKDAARVSSRCKKRLLKEHCEFSGRSVRKPALRQGLASAASCPSLEIIKSLYSPSQLAWAPFATPRSKAKSRTTTIRPKGKSIIRAVFKRLNWRLTVSRVSPR